jgi:hypothetical protein
MVIIAHLESASYRKSNILYDFLHKSVHAGIFLGGPQALQTTRYAHDASRIHLTQREEYIGTCDCYRMSARAATISHGQRRIERKQRPGLNGAHKEEDNEYSFNAQP